jgi:integrase
MAWKLVTGLAGRAGVRVVDAATGLERPATGLDFRHGAAVHQLRHGVPLSEVQTPLAHARLDTTAVYTRLTAAARRRYTDRVAWRRRRAGGRPAPQTRSGSGSAPAGPWGCCGSPRSPSTPSCRPR